MKIPKSESFILKASLRHNNIYDYSLVQYVNSITKVCIICKTHGEFWVRPDAHVRKVGCPSCNGGVIYTKDKFIEISNIVHSNTYDYSLVEYKNSTSKVIIICPTHGQFLMPPSSHLQGRRCHKCSNVYRKTTEEFITSCQEVHKDIYDYSLVKYVNNRNKIKIICKKHGEFDQIPKDHLRGRGCSKCRSSKGENLVSNLLKEKNIDYSSQYMFDDCKGKTRKLPFDFYLPEYNVCIEYDGKFHFEDIFGYGNETIKSDNIKDEFCKLKNIKLFRIKYFQEKLDIEDMINYLSNPPVSVDSKSLKEHRIPSTKSGFLQPTIFNRIESNSMRKDFIEFIDGEIDGEFIVKNDIYFKFLTFYDNCELNVKRHKVNKSKTILVFEDLWRKKNEIVKSRIDNLLGRSKKIYARNCKVVTLNKCSDFLTNNHLQGNLNSQYKFGLTYNGELVSVMTFGKLRKSMGSKSADGHYELARFCNKIGFNIVGGSSKLYKFFIKTHNVKSIVSYADRCWSNEDNMYEKLGMKFLGYSKPSYFYLSGMDRKYRFSHRKDILIEYGYDKDHWTEREICLSNKIFRIYDMGTLRYKIEY